MSETASPGSTLAASPEQVGVRVADLTPDRVDDLARFFAELPEGDRTFVKEAVDDPEVLRSWAEPGRRGRRWVALDSAGGTAETVVAFVALLPLVGWSSHVGEIRLVVAPAARGRGVGALLAREALTAAVEMGLEKVVVEVVAVQESTIGMFNRLGFRAEALLVNQIRDRSGELQDLVVLAHDVQDAADGMASAGIGESLSG